MKKVQIKYNPYRLETDVTIDGRALAQNSLIAEKCQPGIRLQEWIEDLPKMLLDECNTIDFDILFHGTLMDYEDLTEVFTKASERDELTARLERIPAKETSDKEVLIDEVFQEIQEGPFDELKDMAIISAFKHARSRDFEVCVVATMSAGKSTLINSLLGAKLMPSKQEACTAIITRIKDVDNGGKWQAEVYNSANNLIETHDDLAYETMVRLNGDKNVSIIKAEGDIPFVTAENISLVLIDTPGPNNSRDPEHKKIQSEFLNKSSKSLVLYIMEGTFGSDDDNTLLQRVADSMKVGGRQSKDRFIFVVNKMDDRRQEDGDTAKTLDRVREYLKGHGIANPNLFPTAALPALNIRLMKNGVEVDEDTQEETDMKVRKLNRNDSLHFENYASLPASLRGEIKAQLEDAKSKCEVDSEALVHSGVISIEAAIRQYVQKYAKTAKVKNIVDTFMHKLEEVGCFEKTKQELAKNRDEGDCIAREIENIRKKVDDVKSAKKFQSAVDDAVVQVNKEATEIVEGIIGRYQSKIRTKITSLRGRELSLNEVKSTIDKLKGFVLKLEPDFQNDFDELIRENLVKTGETLLQEYKKKLASLTRVIVSKDLVSVTIDPLKFMEGSFVGTNDVPVNQMIKSKKVKDGKIWIENEDKAWYKPWTWFDEPGRYKDKFKTVQYIPANEVAQEFFGLLHVFCGAPPPQGDEPNVQNGCLNQPTFGFPA